MQSRIIRYLLQHGFKAHYKGFNYLVCILLTSVESETRLSMGELYMAAAEKYGVSWQCVESCIRNMIEARWRDSGATAYKPTNSEYIARLTTIMRLNDE